MSSKVSSAKGSKGQKKPAQKHKNTFAFLPNKFSPAALKIAATPIQGVCQRCKDILEWKVLESIIKSNGWESTNHSHNQRRV